MNRNFPQKILICPKCRSDKLKFLSSTFSCDKCRSKYQIVQNKYIFTRYTTHNLTDSLDKIKYRIKGLEKIYSLGIYIFSPVYLEMGLKHFLSHFVRKNAITINLGSGNSMISKNVYNLDIFNYPNTDIVCNMEDLPFANNSVDNIINIAVLEHVPNPEKVVAEIHRVLKNKGHVFSHFPFICGFHASPYDFSRRTSAGLRHLYKDFTLVDLKPASGPTSAMLWIFQEWLAILLSFGIKPLHRIFYFIIMFLTFPIKFLDLILIHHPLAKNISFAFVFTGQKKEKK